MRNPVIHKTKQRGQAIVLIAILMIALVASLGLAIDGGGMFLLYREVQNATDASGLSAAFALCSGGDPVEAAEHSLELNGFENGVDGVIVDIQNPPPAGTTFAGDDEYVYISILAPKPSYFIQIVYPQPLEIRTQTTAFCTPEHNFGWPENSAMVSLEPGCANGNQPPFRVTGNGTYTTVGGGVFVNGDDSSCGSADTNGNNSSGNFGGYGMCALDDASDPDLTATEGGSVTSYCNHPQITDPDPYRTAGLTEPDCASMPFHGTLNEYGSLATARANPNPPGRYTNFDISDYAYLASGIYCVGESNIQGHLESDSVDGVMIVYSGYRLRQQGGGSNNELRLYAITDENSDYHNLLFWATHTDVSNSDALSFGGGALFALEGTIYAPYKHCNVTGNSSGNTVMRAQFICRTVDGNGGGTVRIEFDPSRVYSIPPEFGVAE